MNGSNKKNTTGLKVISLLLALMLWLFVTNENVIITRKEITGVKLNPINLGEGLKASHVDKVSVEIIGTPKKASDVHAYVDLKGLDPGIYTLPVKVDPLAGARVTRINPERVKVQVFKTEENVFPVTCKVTQPPPAGYTVLGVIPVPGECVVKGPQETVRKVTAVIALLDLSDLSTRADTSSFYAVARAVDAGGQPVNGDITVIPGKVKVYVVLGQERTVTEVPVNPTLDGKLPEGYVLGNVRVEPDKVTLVRPGVTPTPVSQVMTSPVSLDGRISSFTEEVSVSVPEGVSAFPERVRVMVEVKPAVGGEVQ